MKRGSTEYNIFSLRLAYKIVKNKYVNFGITSEVGRFKLKILSRGNYKRNTTKIKIWRGRRERGRLYNM